VLVRFAYLAVSNTFAVLHLLPMSSREKDAETLALRHRVRILQRQLGGQRVRLELADRVLPTALLSTLPRETLRRLQLAMSPDTVLRWHRDLLNRRHAARSRPKRPGRPGRPRTVASIRRLVLRLARENGTRGYRRIHRELALLGVTVAAYTVWEILKDAGVDPAPDRAATGWAASLEGQAEAIMAYDFIETVTLSGQRQ
jgi:putative transposase